MSIHTYSVPDMMGGCCVGTVKNAVNSTPFRHCTFEVDALSKTLTLYLKDDDETFKHLKTSEVDELIFSALRDVGFDNTTPKGVVKKTTYLSHAFWGALGLSVGFLLLLLPLLLTTMPFFLVASLALLSTGLTIGLGWSFYRRAYHGLWQRAWTMDTLFSISTAVILGVSISALFVPGLPMMFEAGLLIFGFRHAGIAIADAFKAKLLGVRRFQDDAPQKVTCDNGEVVALDKVKPGDRLLVSPGEMLAVDGVFESGSGMVSSLYQTGSNQSKPLVIGQLYPAGTKLVSVSEPLTFCVKEAANDSFLAREDRAILKAKLNRALEKKPPKSNGFAYWLQFFVPTVVAVALISGVAVGVYFGSWMLAIQCAACVLVASCPCTLGLIAPLVTHVGIKKIEKTGIHFREPDHLEMVNKIDCVMIDLNGTVTYGMPKVVHPEANQKLLALMAHLEKTEDHWVARAIKKAAKGLPFEGGECTRLASTHNGHRVLFEGEEYVLGNRLMMEELGIASDALDVSLGLGESVVYLARAGQLVGHLVLEDKIRDGTYQMVNELQASGKKVYLCTGSDKETANRYATALKIPTRQVFSDCTIDGKNSKQAHLEALKKQGHHVAMIGDAGNDARVIAKSHFGLVVAHEGGHVGTQQGASAVLQTDSLLPVLQLFKIADKTNSNINQNVYFSFAYNILAMSAPAVLLLSCGVVLNPAVGAALMILQTLLIFANVYRFDTEEEEVLVDSKKPAAGLYSSASASRGGYEPSLGLSAQNVIPEPTPERRGPDNNNGEGVTSGVTALQC